MRALPRWFGIEAALVGYVTRLPELLVRVARADDTFVGFIAIERHTELAAELAQRGAPPVQIGSFTAALSPETIGELKAAAARAKSAAATPASSAIVVGAAVLVTWNDGNRYRGSVQALGEGQIQVGFPGGAVHWIPAAFVALA